MKITRFKKSAALALFIFAALVPQTMAADFQYSNNTQSNGNVEVPATATSRNLYTAGMHVIVNANPAKDLVAAGKTIIVNGNVGDDLIAAGQTLTIKGNIGGSARVAGADIYVSSPTVSEDFLSLSSTLDIDSTTTIKGDFVAAGVNIVLNGNVLGNVKVTAGRMTINGKVDGNVDARLAQSLELGPQAVVKGNINYSSPQQLIQDQGAVVTGQISFTVAQERHSIFPALTVLLLIKLIGALLAAYLLFALSKRRFIALSQSVGNKFWINVAVGFVAAIVVPIVSVLLFVTFIGYYIAILLLAWFGLMFIIGTLISMSYFGSWVVAKIEKKEMKIDYITIAVGTVLIGVFIYVPLLGWLLGAVLSLAGFGAMLRAFDQERKQ